MGISTGRVLIVAAVCLLGATGCETSTKLTGFLGDQRDESITTSTIARPGHTAGTATTGAAATTSEAPTADAAQLLGQDPNDDLSLGKKYFRSGNFGLAEKHFRRAVELHPKDAESWVGLAATYDRLKRFELADRAYTQAAQIVGNTPEIMNNRGFSYILRGDYLRARRTLLAAQAKAPENPYIRNNLELLDKTKRSGKSVNAIH